MSHDAIPIFSFFAIPILKMNDSSRRKKKNVKLNCLEIISLDLFYVPGILRPIDHKGDS